MLTWLKKNLLSVVFHIEPAICFAEFLNETQHRAEMS